MKNLYTAISLLLLASGCNKKKFFDGPNFFQDGFETYTALNELISHDDTNWSFTQLTRVANQISVDTTHVHSGSKSLKFVATKSDEEVVSKCSIAKQNMAYWDGETIAISAWYFMDGTKPLDWLFLFDLEEQVTIGAGPGMRLALVNNQLRVEYKFYEKDIVQTPGKEVDFPRNQWVELVWEVKLSQQHEGTVKLWQNGQLLIDSKNNRTLPKDILYSMQGTKGMYSSVEVGITANSRDNDLTIWMDDVKFEKVK